ncbi:hypothetical protein HK098_004377 [Nowakowskiella sp. JEL0407]|nr:hypothetical protein HK098_004377 [Nowakowskiella sp. JEL0407]
MSEVKKPRIVAYQWLIAFAAGMGGLCFGYEIGVIGQVLPMADFGYTFGYFDKDGNVPPGTENSKSNLEAWITTSFTIGCFFGAIFASRLADILSRRWSIFVAGCLFFVGGILQSTATGLAQLIIGRVISGVSIGFASMTVPLYISEISATDIRGAMIAVYQLMITIGIFIATAVNSGIILSYKSQPIEWKLALGIQVVPGVILTLLVLLLPFSPRWLMMRDREAEALAVLKKLNPGDDYEAKVNSEYQHIKDSVVLERKIGEGTWAEVFGKGIRNRVLIGFLLQFFQQWTGINIILYYGPTIFQGVGFSDDQRSIALPLANAAINIIGTLPGMYWIDKYGRRTLLFWGAIVMGVSHSLVCLFFGLSLSNPSLGWGAIIFVYVFILGFSSTWGPIAWVYQSEIFPLRVRARGTGIATMSNWGWNAIVGNTAIRFFDKNVLYFYSYIIYAAACFIMAVYVWFFVPETMHKSIEDMDEIFGAPEKVAEATEETGELNVSKAAEVNTEIKD